jgi:hypothetical protein
MTSTDKQDWVRSHDTTDEIRVRADGQPMGRFPGSLTPGETYRIEEMDKAHAVLSGVNVPTVIDNRVLTLSERVQWLADRYNIYEGRFLCPSCNEVWENDK